MRTFKNLKRFLSHQAMALSLLALGWTSAGNAQLSVAQINATQAMNELLGPGVTVTNASFTGDASQLGRFTSTNNPPAPSLGIASGVLLTTGTAVQAANANNSRTESLQHSHGGDNDLSLLLGTGSAILDVAILEFDFIPAENMVEFDFIFASEEREFECTQGFIDIMGFFISGPGIAGGQGFSNNAMNLALIPGTTLPVSICNVNESTNSQFYNENFFDDFPGNQANLEFEGFTTPFTATANNLICGEEYHIKIAIADVRDRLLDSGVFLETGSLTSPTDVLGMDFPAEICEDDLVTLTVNDNASAGNTYQWSTGATTRSISEIVRLGSDPFSVTVTTPSGCQKVFTSNIIVHPAADTPPFTTGYNGTGEFITVINANQIHSTQIFGEDDDALDNITMSWNNGLSGAAVTVTGNNTPNPVGTLVWVPTASQLGDHSFTVTTTGTDLCGSSTTTETYKVRVICEHCPVELFHENRSQSTFPLPQLTEAGGFLTAGRSVTPLLVDGPVDLTGTAGQTQFAAGVRVRLKPGFTAKPNDVRTFRAFIDDICTEQASCDNCCVGFTGFTHDPLPNIFTPDGDGVNDHWVLSDNANPFCAYGATEYELKVYNRWGVKLYDRHVVGSGCCPFQSHTNGLPDIHWDGRKNNGNLVSDGSYTIYVKLVGCESELELFAEDVAVLGPNKRSETTSINEEVAYDDNRLTVFPNPATSSTTLSFQSPLEAETPVHLMDVTGKVLGTWTMGVGEKSLDIDMAEFAKGSYFLRIIAPDQSAEIRTIIKE